MLKPNAKAVVLRTAMIGGGLSYDVYVPIKYIHNYDGCRYTTIHQDGEQYVDYPQATMPEEHYAMPLGWDRYEHALEHEKNARKTMLTLARNVFSELSRYDGESLPILWVNGLMGDRKNEVSDSRTISL